MKDNAIPFGYTVAGVIAQAGGYAVVAKACALAEQSVRKWRYIPSRHARAVAILAGLPIAVVRPDLVQNPEIEASIK